MSEPWKEEPDRVEYEELGFLCLILRSKSTGTLCGYIGIPPGHPWYEKDYDDIDADVHGGLTYARGDNDYICHKDKPIPLWWIGFDCAHAGDLIPKISELSRIAYVDLGSDVYGTYKDINYVKAEIRRLAEQALAVTEERP